MEAVITDKEKIGHILILKQDEEWSNGYNANMHYTCTLSVVTFAILFQYILAFPHYN